MSPRFVICYVPVNGKQTEHDDTIRLIACDYHIKKESARTTTIYMKIVFTA